MSQFHEFLVQTNVIGIIIGFMVSSQANQLTNEFLASFVSPLISYIFDKTNAPIEDKKVIMFGVEFQVARFIVALIRLTIVLSIVYAMFRIVPMTTTKPAKQ
jgi:large-conductance mechanosensitive channel